MASGVRFDLTNADLAETAKKKFDRELKVPKGQEFVVPRCLSNGKRNVQPLLEADFQNDTLLFEVNDVPGNGHCLFLSVMKALDLSIDGQYSLRKMMIRFSKIVPENS